MIQIWGNFYALLLQWRHFNANRGESELRDLELSYIMKFADVIDNPLAIYESLKPWAELDIPLFDERSEFLKRRFTQLILDHIENTAIKAAFQFIQEPGKIKRLRSKEGFNAAKYLLTNFSSPCFKGEHKERLIKEVESRAGTINAKEDAMDLLEIYLSNLRFGNFSSDSIPNEIGIAISENSQLIVELWKLIISSPSQYRVLESIRENRRKLIAAGIPEQAIEEPDWLLRREP